MTARWRWMTSSAGPRQVLHAYESTASGTGYSYARRDAACGASGAATMLLPGGDEVCLLCARRVLR